MAGSWFTSKKDADLARDSAKFAAGIATAYASLGLSSAQQASFASANTAWQQAFAAIDPSTKNKVLVVAKNTARENMRVLAASLGGIVIKQLGVSDETKTSLGLATRAQPVYGRTPGTPFKFASKISINGVVTTTWACENHRLSGVMYQVYRKLGESGSYVYLGGVGEKKFVDAAIPAGTASVTYQIQAVRSTAAGEWAEYKVQLGGGAGENGVPVTTTAPVKIAA